MPPGKIVLVERQYGKKLPVREHIHLCHFSTSIDKSGINLFL